MQYGPQWDNYPIDFNISKKIVSRLLCISERNAVEKKSCNQKIHQKKHIPDKKREGGIKRIFTQKRPFCCHFSGGGGWCKATTHQFLPH